MNANTTPEQLQLNLIVDSLPKLNTKAMLVKLTQSKPRLSKRNVADEAAVQQYIGDAGAKLYGEIFVSPGNPVRHAIQLSSAVYTYHKKNTLAYEDRGPRLLPATMYEKYRDEMRKLINACDASVQTILPSYDKYVQDDIDFRNFASATAGKPAKATKDDYPTADQFAASMHSEFRFSPLPDQSHWLFDVSDEDKATLTTQLEEAEAQIRNELHDRIRTPLIKMVEKLRIPAGEKGSIFRDSLVENLHESVTLVRQMAMGDPTILAMCDEVEQATTGHARNPQVLRESPIVREQAAQRLAEVAKKMDCLFGSV